jgi:hypothetical protein
VLDAVAAAPDAGVRWVAASGSTEATPAVDVTGFEEVAVASLRAHKAYLEGLGGEEESLRMVLGALRSGGEAIGVELAATFELIEVSAAPAPQSPPAPES